MTIIVTRDPSGRMRHTVRVRDHALTVDALPQVGGEDTGPDPHDLYDAALGACKALTILWFAQRKSIPVDGIEVTVNRDASAERDGIYRLSAEIEVTGALSEAQRAELLAAAQKCPIHKLMSAVETQISTSWK